MWTSWKDHAAGYTNNCKQRAGMGEAYASYRLGVSVVRTGKS